MSNILNRLILPLLISFILNTETAAQSFDSLKLDSLFSFLDENELAMGSLAISHNGVIQYQEVAGYAFIDSTRKIPASVNTKYRIGSTTKIFTAVMIFQLIEEGKLHLGETLDLFYPLLPNAKKITISNLLNHRSGLHNFTDDAEYFQYMDEPKSHNEMLSEIIKAGADFEPDAKAAYSNANYLILGYIIEQLDKMDYQHALERRVISKLGLLNTYFGNSIDINRNECFSYKRNVKKWIKEKITDLSNLGGAGAIVSTPADLVKFIEALFSGKLVSKANLEVMKTMTDGYGMGLAAYTFKSKSGFGHNGRIEEFYTTLQYFPDDSLAAAYCTNGVLYPRSDILNGVLNICFNEPYEIPSFDYSRLRSENLNKYTGTYTSSQPPLTVVCSNDNLRLLFNTKGVVFETIPIATNYFMNSEYGYFFEFSPDFETLMIKETDNVYYLKK